MLAFHSSPDQGSTPCPADCGGHRTRSRGARRPCPQRDCPAAPSRRPGCARSFPAACPGLARWSAGCSRPARCKDTLAVQLQAGTEMQPLGQRLLPEQDAEILQAGPVIGQVAASHGGAGAAVAGLGIGQVDQAVLGEIRRQGHVEQAALPCAATLGTPFKGADRPPGMRSSRRLPGRSVMRMPPSGRKAMAQGCSRRPPRA